jgi:hypothetical protein
LQGTVTAINTDGTLAVRILLSRENLPSCLNWASLGDYQMFQTDLSMNIMCSDIDSVVRCMPHQLYQQDTGCVSHRCDVVIVGHLTVRSESDARDTLTILEDLPTSMLEIYRLKPLKPTDLFEVLHHMSLLFGCRGGRGLFGIGNRPQGVYVHYLSNAIFEFALGKCLKAKDTRRDNTAHLNIFGPVLMEVLYSNVSWGDACIKFEEGTVTVTLSTFEDANPVLSSADGIYDLTPFGYGFVQLYAPIAFKWEMHDTGCGRAGASRAVDGFTAITFESYVERDRHNQGFIKGTRSGANNSRAQNQNKRQLHLPPSRCPR